jgi:uncharacterized protein YndB with AHSA1/START domain
MKLNYRYEMVIRKPIRFVVDLYTDRDQLSKWQRGLLNSELLPDADGRKKYKLTFQLGKRKMFITETILRNELPEYYEVQYKMKGAQHVVKNRFTAENSSSTKWIYDVEFTFKGLMNQIAGFMKSGFDQQSRILMNNFKMFAEKSQ